MSLPIAPSLVESYAGFTPSLFNMPDQASLDAFVQQRITFADSWLQAHLPASIYNVTSPASWANLQIEAELYLTMEKLSADLENLKVMGTYFPYMQEDSPNFQRLINEAWGERAIAALDLWISVEVDRTRAFALPLFVATSGFGPREKNCDTTFEPQSWQLTDEIDYAGSFAKPDIGTLRR